MNFYDNQMAFLLIAHRTIRGNWNQLNWFKCDADFFVGKFRYVKRVLNWKRRSRRSIYIIVAKWIRTFQLSFSMLHRLFVCYTEWMRISQHSFWKRKSFRLDLISRKLLGGKLGVKSTKNLLHRSTQITYGVCLVNGYV